jgi:fatty acid desaturase
MDFGLFQLTAIIDRSEIKGNLFMTLTSFGDHILHHMFPTLDHSVLPLLYPTFYSVCEEFHAVYREMSWPHLIIGQNRQLARIESIYYNPVANTD